MKIINKKTKNEILVIKLIEENYFNFKLGLSLSNKWFRKREIN